MAKERKVDEYGNKEPLKIVGAARVAKHTTTHLARQAGRMLTGDYQRSVKEEREERKAAAKKAKGN